MPLASACAGIVAATEPLPGPAVTAPVNWLMPLPPLPFAAAVIRPLPSTVMFALVNEPTFALTVARVAVAPLVVTSPVRFPAAVTRPFPFAVTEANVPMLLLTVASVAAVTPGPVAVTSPVSCDIPMPLPHGPVIHAPPEPVARSPSTSARPAGLLVLLEISKSPIVGHVITRAENGIFSIVLVEPVAGPGTAGITREDAYGGVAVGQS